MKKTYLALILLFTFSALADVTLTKIDFSKTQSKGKLKVGFKGEIEQYPSFTVIGDTILLKLSNARLSNQVDMRKNFSTNLKDTRVRAYHSKKNEVKVKAAFPFKMQKYKDLVSLTIRKDHIELTFPKINATTSALKKLNKSNKVVKQATKREEIKKSASVTKELLNENYLNSLSIKEDKKKIANKVAPINKTDTVKTTLAANDKAPAKKAKSSISLASYAGKFVAFLGLVLLLFWGVVTIMKKGFIKKGKLGFLNKTDQVTVLSQTHIAPKKSLMLIQAHNQVFLVSNTDAGIHPISEIKDPSGLIKNGEKIISGSNFDDSLNTSSKEDKKFKLKEDISASNKQSSLSDLIGPKDKVKFSDQLKNKVKNLKPLQ